MISDPEMNHALTRQPREDRLPVYAQQLLRTLRTALAEQRDLAEDAVRRTDPASARLLLDPYGEHGGVGLRVGSMIRFRLDGGGCVEVEAEGDAVRLTADGLVMQPVVGNVVRVLSRREVW